jgi:trehalose 6-phosphate synthase/phosphatase
MLWPLFHYLVPLNPVHGGRFNRLHWQAYVSVNKIFSDKVMEVICLDDDYV